MVTLRTLHDISELGWPVCHHRDLVTGFETGIPALNMGWHLFSVCAKLLISYTCCSVLETYYSTFQLIMYGVYMSDLLSIFYVSMRLVSRTHIWLTPWGQVVILVKILSTHTNMSQPIIQMALLSRKNRMTYKFCL